MVTPLIVPAAGETLQRSRQQYGPSYVGGGTVLLARIEPTIAGCSVQW
jgi:hypothetical protein